MTLILAVTLFLGFYMAWNIGANDVANAMGTSVGSKALTLRRAVLLAAILEFGGAFLAGSNVSETIQHGIVSPELFYADPQVFVLGMMGSLLATGALLQLASYFGLPVSTTHAIVGAVVGFGAVIGGVHAIQWQEVCYIASGWILSPFLSGVISYGLFCLIQKKILYALHPTEAAYKLAPVLVLATISVAAMSLCYEGFHLHLSFFPALGLSLSIGLVAALLSRFFLRRRPEPELVSVEGFNPYQAVSLEKALHHLQRVHLSNRNDSYGEQISHVLAQVRRLNDVVKKNTHFSHTTSQYLSVEKLFVFLQILTACLIAFAHGANDVANAIGPVAAVLNILQHNTLHTNTAIPSWLLALGGAGIVIGLATWGWRVIETVGEKITELTPTRGFCAEFGAAFTILFASKLGLPISTTHALVGSVLGVGMARGLQALNLQMLREIVVSWVVTIPLCALFSIGAFYLLKLLFL
ncbi:MAG: inorganic phosphate transporter [Verrucomicrobiota bacterium]|nr:inorganic phosphate transporter [Verrucomicrobiota bacterium]